ncbi:MAG: cytochrome c biogenesis CcdA family protein [bacterium]|nr:cytochrome c biogenesis CcdA family protein [bacterium]
MDNIVQVFSTNTAWYILLATSFLGGILASISPCSLAMLPLIVGYVGGYSQETPFRTFLQLIFFIFGTAIVFTIIGVVCALTGSVFASAFGAYFTLIIASFLMIMGLKLVRLLDFEIPVIIKSMPTNKTNSLFVYPVLLGITFALAGTPCSTPILAGIMAFAAIGKNLWLAILMLFLFALGQGTILIIAGLFTSGLKNMKSLARFTEILLKISGVLLIAVAIFFYWRVFAPLF